MGKSPDDARARQAYDEGMNNDETKDTIRLRISKLDDAAEAAQLEKALEAVPGVSDVAIDPETNEAVVRHQEVEPKKLTQALRQQGYISDVA